MKYVVIDGRKFVDKEEFKAELDSKLVPLQVKSYMHNADEYVKTCRKIVKEA